MTGLQRIRRPLALAKSAADRLYRNRAAFRDFYRLATTRDERERKAILDQLNAWIARKQIDPLRQRGLDSVKGFPKILLEKHPDLLQALDSVPHLGALTEMATASASRFDYVCIQFDTLLRFKEAHPGMGLGTGNRSDDAIVYGAKAITGLELTQSWALLLNLGHLFGTFATERALLWELDRDPDLVACLLDVDDQLKPHVEALIQSRPLYACGHILAAWRISRWPSGPERQTAVAALQRFLDASSSPRVQRLHWAFRRSRQLSYLLLHRHLGIGGMAGSPSDETVALLIEDKALGFDPATVRDNPTIGLLDSIEEFHTRTVFTSPRSSSLVLAHLRSFKHWWAKKREQRTPIEERMKSLFAQPDDWPALEARDLRPFARIELPPPGNWLEATRTWYADGAVWGASNFLVTYNPRRKELLCDLYVESTEEIRPATVGHVAKLLAEECRRSWQPGNEENGGRLWRSIADFGIRLANLVIREKFALSIAPVPAREPSIGYAVLAPDGTLATERIKLFAGRCEDGIRSAELSALAEFLEKRNFAGPVLAFLGRTHVTDSEDHVVQELDGLWAEISDVGIVWHAIEVKTGQKARGASSQLAELATFVNRPITTISEGKRAHVSFSWGGEST